MLTNIAAAILAGGKNSRMLGFNKAFINIDGIPIIQRTLGILKKIFLEIILVTNSKEDFRLYENDCIVAGDLIKNAGPLGGMHRALARTSKDAVFFIACDMPNLDGAIIRRQIDYFYKLGCDCLVPRIGSCLEPLHAVYKASLKDDMRSFFRLRAENHRHKPVGKFRNSALRRDVAKSLEGGPRRSEQGERRRVLGTTALQPWGSIKNSRDYSVKSFLKTVDVRYFDLVDNVSNRKFFKNLNTPQDLKEIGCRAIRSSL